MGGSYSHDWLVSAEEARAIQERLSQAVIARDEFGPVRTVAGVDVGLEDNKRFARTAVVVLSFPGLELLESSLVRKRVDFPYIPGLLSFREAPAALEALNQLSSPVDLLICDGQGIAHPRRFGLACHIGLLRDLPSIGVAKTRLIGQHETLLEEKGSQVPLWDRNEVVGMVQRTRANVKPLYISVGHRISIATAVYYVLACTPSYRLPETTRWAHKLATGRE